MSLSQVTTIRIHPAKGSEPNGTDLREGGEKSISYENSKMRSPEKLPVFNLYFPVPGCLRGIFASLAAS